MTTDHAPIPAAQDETGVPPIEAALAGAYGALRQRLLDSPLKFAFNWHGIEFTGRFSALDEGVRLTLHSDLAALPYSAEDAGARSGLLGVFDVFNDETVGTLKVVSGQKIIIEKSIDLPQSTGDAASDIVANLTILVLRAAPYLDLFADGAPLRQAPAEAAAAAPS